MTYKYLIKIVTKHVQTKFQIETEKSISDVKELHKYIIDFIAKKDINWEPNPLKYTGGFYITYEEVNDGSRQHGVVREETQARV